MPNLLDNIELYCYLHQSSILMLLDDSREHSLSAMASSSFVNSPLAPTPSVINCIFLSRCNAWS